jgi:hypothetical protein
MKGSRRKRGSESRTMEWIEERDRERERKDKEKEVK